MRSALTWIIVILFFSAVALFAYRKLVFSSGVIWQGESSIPPFPYQLKQFLIGSLHSWSSQFYFGGKNFAHPITFYGYFLIYILASFGADGVTISNAAFVFPMAMAGISMFYLCRRSGIGFAPSMVGGFFYQLTPNAFDRAVYGHWVLLFDYGLMPLVLAWFMNLLEEKYIPGRFARIRTIAVVAMLFLASTQHIAAVPFLAISFLLFSLIHGGWKRKLRVILSDLGLAILVVAVASLLLHSIWLDIYFTYTQEAVETALGYVPLAAIPWTKGTSPLLTMRLLSDIFFKSSASAWHPWVILSFVPTILAFAALLFNPRDKRVLFFSSLALLGITFASATEGALGQGYVWLLESLPPLQIYLYTDLWSELAALGLAPLIALTTHFLLELVLPTVAGLMRRLAALVVDIPHSEIPIRFNHAKIISSVLICLIFAGMIAAAGWPYLTGDAGGLMQTYDFSRYREAYDWLYQESGDFRVLSLPAPYPTIYSDQKLYAPFHDVLSRIPADKDGLYWGSGSHSRYEMFLYKSLYDARTMYYDQLLRIAGVKYVMFDPNKRSGVTECDSLFFQGFFPEEAFTNVKLESALSQQSELNLSKVFESVKVYDNSCVGKMARISPFTRLALVGGDLTSLVSLSYIDELELENMGIIFAAQLSPTEFKTVIQNEETVVILQEGHFLDIVFASAEDKILIEPVNHVVVGDDPTKGWSIIKRWYNWYGQAQLYRPILSLVESNLTLPLTIAQDSAYEFYINAYVGPETSNIRLIVDDSTVDSIITNQLSKKGFQWFHLGSLNLTSGTHLVKLESGKGVSMAGNIVVISKDSMNRALAEVNTLIKERPLIMLSEFDRGFQASVSDRFHSPDEIAQSIRVNWVSPVNASYSMYLTNDSFAIQMRMENEPTLDEIITMNVPLPGYDIATYSDFELAFRLEDAVKTRIEITLLVDEDGNGKVDAWVRLAPWVEKESHTIRAEGIHDIMVPPRIIVDQDYTLYQIDVFDAIEKFIPEGTHTLLGVSIQFLKIPGMDLSGEYADDFTLHLGHMRLHSTDLSILDTGTDASQAQKLQVRSVTAFNYSLPIMKDGDYQVKIRAAGSSNSSSVVIRIGTTDCNISLGDINHGFKWYNLGTSHLEQGPLNISFHLSNRNRFFFDQLLILEDNQPPTLVSASPTVTFTYERIHSAMYNIHVNASEPFFLFFSESYDRLWILSLEDGERIYSLPGFSYGNMYYLNRTGSFDATLKFATEDIYNFAIWTSVLTLTTLMALVLIPLYPSRRMLEEPQSDP